MVRFAKLTFLWNPGESGMPTTRTAKHLLHESTTKSVESGTYDVVCQFRFIKGMVVELEVLKAQNCALSKLSLPMHSNDENFENSQNFVISKHTFQGIEFFLEKIARRIRLCTASILVIFVL